jgi:hypothetical protein
MRLGRSEEGMREVEAANRGLGGRRDDCDVLIIETRWEGATAGRRGGCEITIEARWVVLGSNAV